MRKLLLAVAAVCALGLFAASAQAAHGYGGCGGGGFYGGPSYGHGHGGYGFRDYGYRGRGFVGGRTFYAPQQRFFRGGHGHPHHHHGGLHVGGRRFHLGIGF